MTMTTSAHGRGAIEGYEGCRLTAYPDFRKPPVWTIGYGHTYGVMPGDTCTQEQADEWMTGDLGTAEGCINTHVTVPLTQNEFDALVSLTFNEGAGAIAASTLVKKLNTLDFAGAADEFLRWDKVASNGRLVDSPGLEARRQAERAMFLG